VLCLGRSRRVLLANARARALLAERDGLRLEGEHLQIDDRQAAPAVQAAIDAALGREAVIDSRDVAPCEACATLPRPSGRAALTVLTTPLLTCDKLSQDERGLVLVFLHDPEETPPLRESDLAAMFGLTPAQAKLAALLAQGLSLEDVAARLGLTLNTVRTRVKQVFERTQTSRQADLVRRLVLSAAAFRRR
jgi:DNA-binding CsgD family transcriptional regulator